MSSEERKDGFQHLEGNSLGEVTISQILFEMITHGADSSELKIVLPNGLGVLLGISIKEVFDENEE